MVSRLDMHCHIKGGSIDSRITLGTYVDLLRKQGFTGMLVTDHDSYRAYRNWAADPNACPANFTVLRGVEYDTKDAGHFLVIMPDEVDLKVLTIRGMSAASLIKLVHSYGGVLGPAHPFGARSSSIMFCRLMKKHPEIARTFDFVEGFNTCEKVSANREARAFAEAYGLPCIGGSDSHCAKYVGTAFTDFSVPIKSCDDLIAAIRGGGIQDYGGTEREFRFRHHFRNTPATTWVFKGYNRCVGAVYTPYRRRHLKAAHARVR